MNTFVQSKEVSFWYVVPFPYCTCGECVSGQHPSGTSMQEYNQQEPFEPGQYSFLRCLNDPLPVVEQSH